MSPDPQDGILSTVSKVYVVKLKLHLDNTFHFPQRSTTPTEQCTSDNEAESIYNPVDPLVIWICKSTTWTPFE